MDVYLDDIVIYSDTVDEHLSASKMQFFASRLEILGHVIDEHGIAMDPHKVDSVANWKVPTNKGLLSSFLGAVGYLAPDCDGIRIPMGVLAPLTGNKKPWTWTATHQRAFDEIRSVINLVTDASLTGASGHVSQGGDLRTARVAVFWSGKFNSAQQNYPVHEQELLAIVESLKRFRGLLQGVHFRIASVSLDGHFE